MSGTLIFGGGQLGQSLKELLPEATVVYHSGDYGNVADISDLKSVERIFRQLKPETVINAAAFTDVDGCETDRERAFAANAFGVHNIVRMCREFSTKLIHISTDYVFSGDNGMYLENSFPDPVNYYGYSKSVGDAFALSLDNSLIVRTSGVFGTNRNFPIFVYNNLKQGKTVNALNGYYSPISSHLLAKSIMELTRIRDIQGIINVAGTRVSRVDFATKIAEAFSLNKSLIRSVDAIPSMKARRPFDSSLDISKARGLLYFDFYSIDANLKVLSESIKGRKIS